MATVRIYKVAELLGTTSQEVLALLKRDPSKPITGERVIQIKLFAEK